MTTQSTQTPSEAPEDRRVHRFILATAAVIIAVPTAAAAVAFATGTSPFPWELIGSIAHLTAVLAIFVGVAVLLVPKLSDWFGAPNLTRPRDERETAIFGHALFVSYLITAIGLVIASVAMPSLVVSFLVVVQGLSLWLGLIFFARRI